MAIYHLSVKIGSRAKGQSAIAASAYRSGEKLTDQETGLTADYTRKGGIVHSEIALCENAPAEYSDRQTLWNEVHKIEKAKDARLWREIEVALPKELSREEQIATIREFVKDLTEKGMCADWSLHDKGDGNPHAHIMLTTRSIEQNGKWAAKSRKVYDLDENGEKIFQKVDKSGRKQYKSHKEDYNDWNKKERVEEWRATWAECCNARLSKRDRIDHRSYKRQGIKQEPTIHEGYAARIRVINGLPSERISINEKIREYNSLQVQIKANDLKILIMMKKQRSKYSATYNEYQKRSSFTQKYFRKKNAAAIEKYEEADKYIEKHSKAYYVNGEEPELAELETMLQNLEKGQSEKPKPPSNLQNAQKPVSVEKTKSDTKESVSFTPQDLKASAKAIHDKQRSGFSRAKMDKDTQRIHRKQQHSPQNQAKKKNEQEL